MSRSAYLSLCALSIAASAQRPADVGRLDAIEHISLFEISHGRDTAAFEALANDWSTDQIRTLVGDDNPKVRAIALVLLHEQLGPRALPTIAKAFDDQAAAPPNRRTQWFSSGGKSTQDTPQTIGSIAFGLVQQYLPTWLLKRHQKRRGFIGETAIRGAFVEYMQTRNDRPHCLAWLRVATRRAAGGTTPVDPARRSKIDAVRQRIDSIPAPHRHWYLLSLTLDWSLSGSKHLATERELIAAAHALGPTALLELLRGFGPADVQGADANIDPDLTATRLGMFAWEAVARFVLKHGSTLLRAQHCDELLEIAAEHARRRSGGLGVGRYGIDTADWFLAAADLQPHKQAAHIHAGLAAIPANRTYRRERGRLAAAAWSRLGDAGQRIAIEYFYDEGAGERFITDLARPDRAAWLWALIGDPRFETLGWQALTGMARASNAHVAPPPFSKTELDSARHPMGSSYDTQRNAAGERYPHETKELERILTGWRSRLRALAAEHGR